MIYDNSNKSFLVSWLIIQSSVIICATDDAEGRLYSSIIECDMCFLLYTFAIESFSSIESFEIHLIIKFVSFSLSLSRLR
jgi:hypothetical protein